MQPIPQVTPGMARIRAERGLQVKIAKALGITRGAVANWWRRGRVPAERVLDLEIITGISRHDLRPDIYPRPYVQNVDEKLANQPFSGKRVTSLIGA